MKNKIILLLLLITSSSSAQLSVNWLLDDFASPNLSEMVLIQDKILLKSRTPIQENGLFKIDENGNIDILQFEGSLNSVVITQPFALHTSTSDFTSLWQCNPDCDYYIVRQDCEGEILYSNIVLNESVPLGSNWKTTQSEQGNLSIAWVVDTSIHLQSWDNQGILLNEFNFPVQDVNLFPNGFLAIKENMMDSNGNLFVVERHTSDSLGFSVSYLHKFDTMGNHLWEQYFYSGLDEDYFFEIINDTIYTITSEYTDFYSVYDVWFRNYDLNGEMLSENILSVYETDSFVLDNYSQSFTIGNEFYIIHNSTFHNDTPKTFITKLNSNGEQMWFTELFEQNASNYKNYSPLITKFDTDSYGNIYYTGKYADSSFLITKLNPEGIIEWEQAIDDMDEGIDEVINFEVAHDGLFYIYYMKENFTGPNFSGVLQIRQWKTNIETITPQQEISIAPNPFTHKLNLQLNDIPKTLNIYNSTGQLIHQETTISKSDFNINTSQWKAGVYFMLTELTDGQLIRKKLVKY